MLQGLYQVEPAWWVFQADQFPYRLPKGRSGWRWWFQADYRRLSNKQRTDTDVQFH